MNQQNPQKDLWKTVRPGGHASFSEYALQNDGWHLASSGNSAASPAPLATGPLSPRQPRSLPVLRKAGASRSPIAAWQHGLVDICWLHETRNIVACQVEQMTGVDSGGYLTGSNSISTVGSSDLASSESKSMFRVFSSLG